MPLSMTLQKQSKGNGHSYHQDNNNNGKQPSILNPLLQFLRMVFVAVALVVWDSAIALAVPAPLPVAAMVALLQVQRLQRDRVIMIDNKLL
mmetsp:Transcript_6679/g.8440  ORF Transcript_6679/g.8440 Transcript_6679/m.8440 type:complete len:91 (+) Transcript_6679:171-443(+)